MDDPDFYFSDAEDDPMNEVFCVECGGGEDERNLLLCDGETDLLFLCRKCRQRICRAVVPLRQRRMSAPQNLHTFFRRALRMGTDSTLCKPGRKDLFAGQPR